MKLNYKWSGSDWNETGKTRVWYFPGNGTIIQYDIRVEDFDGDMAVCQIRVGDEVVLDAEVRTTDDARKTACVFMSEVLGFQVYDSGRDFVFDQKF